MCGDNDVRAVSQRAANGDADANLALDVYCRAIRKYVGAYHAVLGRLDAIVFTAGVGEHSAVVRARSLRGMERLGIALDAAANDEAANDGVSGASVISAGGARVAVCVVPTDEEQAIVEEIARLLGAARTR
jgi:acetate kinase